MNIHNRRDEALKKTHFVFDVGNIHFDTLNTLAHTFSDDSSELSAEKTIHRTIKCKKQRTTKKKVITNKVN